MKSFLKTLKDLPWIVKLLIQIIWGIYGNLIRLAKSCVKKNLLGIILSLFLLIFAGFIILWIYDLYCIIVKKDIWWID